MFGFGFAFMMITAPVTGVQPMLLAMQTIEQRVIIRIPSRPINRPRRRAQPGMVWRELPAAACQPASQIARARFTRPGAVDLLMRDNSLIRARLTDDCVALGYYSAFYIVPGDDGRICADRDVVVSRSGSECAISAFRSLEPHPAG